MLTRRRRQRECSGPQSTDVLTRWWTRPRRPARPAPHACGRHRQPEVRGCARLPVKLHACTTHTVPQEHTVRVLYCAGRMTRPSSSDLGRLRYTIGTVPDTRFIRILFWRAHASYQQFFLGSAHEVCRRDAGTRTQTAHSCVKLRPEESTVHQSPPVD